MSTTSLVDWEPDPAMARAYGLIGEFMCHWAILENSLNNGVHKLCRLTGIEAAAVTANMGVRDKINTVRTMLHISHSSDDDALKRNNKLMDRIGDRSADRNIVAHTQFVSHPKGVQFLVIRAKGRLEIPDTVWTADGFRERGIKMLVCAAELKAAVKVAAERRDHITMLAHGNPFARPPSQEPGLLGGLFHLGRLPPETLDSPTPSQKSNRGNRKGRQTKPKAPPVAE